MNEKVKLTKEQIAARNPSDTFQDLLDRENVPVPEALRESTDTYLGSEDLPIDRWTSREFFELEVEKVWRKTWQMACRVSQVSTPGQYFVYDIVNDSILITCTDEGEIKAYYNSCLHRGRALKRGAGKSDNLRCPYHGWTYSCDGSLTGMPGQQRYYPDLIKSDWGLVQARVGNYKGLIFATFHPNSIDLESDLAMHVYISTLF